MTERERQERGATLQEEAQNLAREILSLDLLEDGRGMMVIVIDPEREECGFFSTEHAIVTVEVLNMILRAQSH